MAGRRRGAVRLLARTGLRLRRRLGGDAYLGQLDPEYLGGASGEPNRLAIRFVALMADRNTVLAGLEKDFAARRNRDCGIVDRERGVCRLERDVQRTDFSFFLSQILEYSQTGI